MDILWLLGIVSANTFGGVIRVLLWAAIAVVLLRVLQGRQKVDEQGRFYGKR